MLYLARSRRRPAPPSRFQAEDDVNDAPDLTEASGLELVDDLHGAILWPVDLEDEAGGSELDEPKPEVPGKAVCIVGLKVADPPIVVLELALQEEVRLGGRRRIVVCGGVWFLNDT